MKRITIWTIAAILCVAALLAGSGMLLYRELGKKTALDDRRYTVGGAVLSDRVENLDIDWTSGAVTIAYHSKNTVEISETASRALTEDETLRWYLDGTTLRIRYAKPRLVTPGRLEKKLTVTLPEGTVLESTRIDATSAEVNVPALRTDVFEAELTSGDLRASLEEAGTVRVEVTSGGIDLVHTGSADSVRLSGTSADIRASLGNVETLHVSTTSGPIRVGAADAGKAEFESTSGGVSVTLDAFRELEIETTSGSVSALIPSAPGFRAEIDTTSGSFESDIALRHGGKAWTCGDESARVEIETTSGDIRLTER